MGTANGVSSFGTAVNQSGQIGGYVTLASGQTEAFLSTAHGGLMVGIAPGAATDSTSVIFLNDNGQAIIWDSTSQMDYLYSAGVVVPLSSLISGFTAGNGQQIVGFNNAGQILLSDPSLDSVASTSNLSANYLSTLSGATSITSLSSYAAMASAQSGATPSASFYTAPSTSTGSGTLTTVGTFAAPTPSVPGPSTATLLALASLGLLGLKRRRMA